MTIITHSKEWNIPLLILTAYIASGFIALFIFPDSLIEINRWHIISGAFGEITSMARDPVRASFYFAWMIALLPITFVAFSVFAPVKIRPDAKPTTGTFAVIVSAFVAFGIFSSPYLIHYVLLGASSSTNTTSHLDRLAHDMARSDISMFYGTSILLCVILVTCWMSYVALPISFVKMLNLRRKP